MSKGYEGWEGDIFPDDGKIRKAKIGSGSGGIDGGTLLIKREGDQGTAC